MTKVKWFTELFVISGEFTGFSFAIENKLKTIRTMPKPKYCIPRIIMLIKKDNKQYDNIKC